MSSVGSTIEFAPEAAPPTLSSRLITFMQALGMRHGFGILGGAIVPFHAALVRAGVELHSCRHENGAVFAALEASLATDRPSLAYTTTGPGLTNALTGIVTARWEGAKLLVISGLTPAEQRGRFAMQESSPAALGVDLYRSGPVFDYAIALEDPRELPQVLRTLTEGFARPGGFVAHLAIPLAAQARPTRARMAQTWNCSATLDANTLERVARALDRRFGVWVGWGARHASTAVRALVERCDAPVISTPRAKGIVNEAHPLHLGVTGIFGGHEGLAERLRATKIERLLVLGTRLGEVSSAYDRALIPAGGLVHVDLDPSVPGVAFPESDTLAVVAEIGALLRGLERKALVCERRVVPLRPIASTTQSESSASASVSLRPRTNGARVRPQYLMQQVQARVVEGSESAVLAESGNAFAWTTRLLRFAEPGRYRQSGLFCPMGHVSAGALGLAAATGKRAVAIVGDGAFVMQNEISSVAHTGLPVTWVVLNDARFGMIEQGLSKLDHGPADVAFPEIDFVALARSMGAWGRRVDSESELADALDEAMQGSGPRVLDVRIDPRERAPFGRRVMAVGSQSREAN